MSSNDNDIAIRVQNLSKCYQIYDAPRDRLKQFIMPRVRRLAGKSPKQYFREFWALNDVSFEIKKGETVGIIGRNGSGKSTLLQTICGTLSPTSGSVETYGRIAALLELGSGFNPDFTGRENVYLSAALLGLSTREVDERFDDIAAFADIGQFIEQPVKSYSSGMYVRLAFAVNIVSDPEIMIVDEALAVGDMNFQAKCMTALTRIQERGATVLFVSHDISALKSLCSRGIYLEHGQIQKIGAAPDVAEQYMRVMREEMNASTASQELVVNEAESATASAPSTSNTSSTNPYEFKRSIEFERRVSSFRYGSGDAKITYAELIDEDFQPLSEVQFNQTVLIRIYIESTIKSEISCNYYILDDKKNFILGTGLTLAGTPMLATNNGDKHVVIYKTKLPLHEGLHSIQLQLTSPLLLNISATFLDVIDDAIVFNMARREGERIWAKVSLENTVKIISV